LYQAWGWAWLVRAKSSHDRILVTFEKLVELGGLSRTECNLSGRDEPI